jgi:hypothetical protein
VGAVATDDDASERKGSGGPTPFMEIFKLLLKKVAPSVGKPQRRRYEALRETFASGFCNSEDKKRLVTWCSRGLKTSFINYGTVTAQYCTVQ